MRPFSNKTSVFVIYRLPVIALCIAIFWQSSYPGLIEKPLFPHSDKVMHFLVYAALAFLTARDLTAHKKTFSIFTIRMTAIVFSSLYGAGDEFHQAFVPERQADFADFIADTLGSILGAFIYLDIYFKKIKSTRLRQNT